MSQSGKSNVRALRKLKFDLENYFANTIIPQLFVDSDLILRIFTPPAMKQFSLSHKDIDRNIAEVKDNIKYPTIIQNIKEVIATQEILEKEVQTTDGKWYEMNIIPYVEHEKGVVNGVIITFVDITSRLTALKELEKLNAEHEVLLFALSHDLRQPISSMTMLADALKAAYSTGDTEKFNKWIEALKSATRHLDDLITDFTSKESNELPKADAETRLNIEEICRDVIDALREVIDKEEIKIRTDYNASEIIFPKNNLRSIIYNLVHNAIKFRDPSRTSEIKITTTREKDFVILCIEDNGLGIPMEEQRNIFHKSTRLHPEIHGTGMGLYIIKRMIESQDGRIHMESTPGEGTLFRVFFKSGFEA